MLGGQYDTEKASLNLYNNGDSSSGRTIIRKSSFSFCRSYCLYAYGHHAATIEDNVFYEGRKFHLKMKKIRSFIVNANLFIGAIFRPTLRSSEAIACVELTNTAPSTSTLSLTNNVCQGSNVNGFALPFLTCGQMNSNPFKNNTAGSCAANGFLIDKGTASGCLGFTGVRAYACSVGQIASPPGTS